MKHTPKDINAAIYHSKNIIRAKNTLRMIRDVKFLLSRSNVNSPSSNCLTSIENEIQDSIKQMRHLVAHFLNLVLKNYKITIRSNFHISNQELKDGYCDLYGTLTFDSNGMPTGPERKLILFLTDYQDAFYKIKSGEVHYFEEVKDILTKVKPIAEKRDMILNMLTYNLSNQNEKDNKQSVQS